MKNNIQLPAFRSGQLTTSMFLLICGVFCMISIKFRAIALNEFTSSIEKEDQYYLPAASWLRIFSSGYNEAIADMIWTKCVIYFSTTSKDDRKRSGMMKLPSSNRANSTINYTAQYVRAVTYLNPQFRAAFSHGARLAMYQGNVITRQNIEAAIDILEKGTKQFPDDGELRFNQGFMYYYELPPFIDNKKERKKIKTKGAELLYEASHLPNAPLHARGMAQSLLTKLNMDDLIIEHLEYMILSETDETIREGLYEDLLELRGEQIKRDNTQIHDFFQQWKADFSYIPFPLFTILYSFPASSDAAESSIAAAL